MDTNALKKFAQEARIQLIEQVASRFDRVIAESSVERREHPQIVKQLDKAVSRDGRAQVIDKVAYTWFNRFTALRFMDANGYNRVRVVSPADGATRPEILAEAAAGNLPDGAPDRIVQLLDGRIPSNDAQGEAYRLLLVHDCNALHKVLPYMFEAIDDFSELLMPDDLLSNDAILAKMRAVMTEDACQDVEIIGWLYQFYISEKKDQVFAGLKKNQKITAENIPAATQLFTPHWIVRYLVENSLGRLWLLNNPHSGLAAKMDYYIAPEEPETDFLKITKPEEIRICDPAAGSGHMLTYAFDLLYAIYEEEGYDATEIPALILTHNLTGVEIDDRAGALAAFALAMKAAGKLRRRRFLRMEAKPDICVLQNVTFTEAEMQDVAAVVGKDLFTDELRETLGQFEQAKNFGSLIVPKLRDPADTLRVVEARDFGGDLLLKEVQERVIAVLRMAEALSPKYHVVVANPPYASASGLNDALRAHSEVTYPESKNDLYSMFIDRNRILARASGYVGMIAMQSWMYLKTFMDVRRIVLTKTKLISLLHLGPRAFPEIQGERVQAASFVFKTATPIGKHMPIFFRLISGKGDEKEAEFLRRNGKFSGIRQADFLKLPDLSVAYKMLSNPVLKEKLLAGDIVDLDARIGSQPGSELIIFWWEVLCSNIGSRWRKYNKGGTFRRWFGNAVWILDYGKNGENVTKAGGQLSNQHFYGKPHISWTRVSGNMNLRFYREGTFFDNTSPAIFSDLDFAQGYLNSKVGEFNRTGKFSGTKIEAGHVQSVSPVSPTVGQRSNVEALVGDLIRYSASDWDAYETSWDFTTLPLLSPEHRGETLADSYATLRAHWQDMTDEMQRLEEENNRIFIDAYGLQDELTPEVPIEEITLTCNPAYRYGVKNSEEDRETRQRADTMAEFLSYAVGCMFGRYSLDAPGLILANQGETLADYLARVPTPSFEPDEDNVIPVLDEDWFSDDIVARFRKFLRVTFGDEHFQENLRFVEKSLGKELRKYFTKDFYNDHVKRYRKRPIYWMFSSPKGTFNALIYMHRYRSDTVSVVLNDYLREFINKLQGERARLDKLADDATATQGQRAKALKDSAKIAKQIDELTEWERDVVFPLAQQRIEIDLDDGVKANYPKFGAALKKIAGLS
ncbi:BREX-1 system adenine-specific DNA-methyltransferase PglX [Ruegeria faecimaris]|uniref:BREX-1 system adenine-specific DNA-methyltransferase PglX n=1 Tax=Ruegeria faecimaris TaxID=686389 RepID=UPI002491A181|nr:BREX-1 system adenine-specific DNA-methyltransferase PglX [Ruegeria faecimaris]